MVAISRRIPGIQGQGSDESQHARLQKHCFTYLRKQKEKGCHKCLPVEIAVRCENTEALTNFLMCVFGRDKTANLKLNANTFVSSSFDNLVYSGEDKQIGFITAVYTMRGKNSKSYTLSGSRYTLGPHLFSFQIYVFFRIHNIISFQRDAGHGSYRWRLSPLLTV